MDLNATTVLQEPYALVARGGGNAGSRPVTTMAYLTNPIVQGGAVVAFRAMIATSRTMEDWHRTVRQVEPDKIVRRWARKPTMAAIEKARGTMDRL